MARIAIFTASLESGGAERISLFVTQALAKAGHDVDLVVQRNEGALVDHAVARRHRIDLEARSAFTPTPLIRYYRERRPDLIIAMARDAKLITGLASQIEPRLPFLISVRGVLERPRLGRFWLRMLGHAPERWLY